MIKPVLLTAIVPTTGKTRAGPCLRLIPRTVVTVKRGKTTVGGGVIVGSGVCVAVIGAAACVVVAARACAVMVICAALSVDGAVRGGVDDGVKDAVNDGELLGMLPGSAVMTHR